MELLWSDGNITNVYKEWLKQWTRSKTDYKENEIEVEVECLCIIFRILRVSFLLFHLSFLYPLSPSFVFVIFSLIGCWFEDLWIVPLVDSKEYPSASSSVSNPNRLNELGVDKENGPMLLLYFARIWVQQFLSGKPRGAEWRFSSVLEK